MILVQCLALVNTSKHQLRHIELDEADDKLNAYQDERHQAKPSVDGGEVRVITFVHLCCCQYGLHRKNTHHPNAEGAKREYIPITMIPATRAATPAKLRPLWT
jgi:hypothetical protein